MSEYILSMQNITKVYDNGIVANRDVSFHLKEGQIHALVGENGAGKSTLMKILFGMEAPTEGQILLRGKKLENYNSNQAIQMGIGMVHQHFMLVDQFTVAQNVMLGIEPKKGLFTDVQACIRRTREASKEYNLQVDPTAVTGTLPVGVKQKIEILKALIRGARILILDEPTAVLTPQETKVLFEELKHLRDMGYSIIFISHKIKEVKELTDRITIMRGGRSVGEYNTADISEKDISALVMGSEIKMEYTEKVRADGPVRIQVQNLSYYGGQSQPILKDVSFSVKGGSILGIAGVQGNGQTELIKLMTKELPLESGSVVINGQSVAEVSIKQLREGGYAYIPEDRLHQGTGAEGTISDNLISSRYWLDFTQAGMLDRKKICSFSQNMIDSYKIKCFSEKQKISMLSGGNMQKVVVARECSGKPMAVIAEQPTRGIDIGAAYMVHQTLLRLRDQGSAVLLVSADLTELIQLCDSLIVLYEGETVAYFEDVTSIEEDELGLCMLGIHRHPPEQTRRALHE